MRKELKETNLEVGSGLKTNNMFKKCIYCGKKFTPKRLFKTAMFCSEYCGLKHWRLNNPEHNRQIKINWRRKNGVLERGSKELREKISKNLTGRFVKEKSGNWKGGITPQNKIERIKFVKQVRKNVFERDNYTCQMCGVRGVDLQVDHIQEWSKYIEGRFDINNCRTLCAKCHYKITFGKDMPEYIKGWGHHLLERERIIT